MIALDKDYALVHRAAGPAFPAQILGQVLQPLLIQGTPETAVTVFPFLPLVSRLMRTTPSPGGAGAVFWPFFPLHEHFSTGCPHWGHTRPVSVE